MNVMVGSLKNYGFWRTYHGREVLLDAHRHRIEVTIVPRYHYHNTAGIIVSAVPVNKDSKFYQETKRKLHDDWMVDVLGSPPEIATDILVQLARSTLSTT
jgi:hypothetical protein